MLFRRGRADRFQLTKIPFTRNLNEHSRSSDPRAEMPAELKNLGVNHYGDIDQARGFVFVPCEGSNPLRLAAFRANDLRFVASAPLPGHSHAAWVAINPTTQEAFIDRSNVLNANHGIGRWEIDWSALQSGRLILADKGTFQVKDTAGAQVSISEYLQGGVFSTDGCTLYLSNGKSALNSTRGAIWVVDAATGRLRSKSSQSGSAGSFVFEHHPGTGFEEPEGLAYVDTHGLSDTRLGGRLHALLANTLGAWSLYLKHYD